LFSPFWDSRHVILPDSSLMVWVICEGLGHAVVYWEACKGILLVLFTIEYRAVIYWKPAITSCERSEALRQDRRKIPNLVVN
jgi:hypothetical protein